MKKLRWILLLGLVLAATGVGFRHVCSTPLSAAEAAYRAGDYERAVDLYGQAVGETDDPGHAVFNRAAARYQAGHLDPASKDFHSAQDTGISKRAARASYDMGNCALRRACAQDQEQITPLLQEAIRSYDQCLQSELGADTDLRDNAKHNRALAEKLLALQPDAPTPTAGVAEKQTASNDKSAGDERSKGELASAEPQQGGQSEAQRDSESGVDPMFREEKTNPDSCQPNEQVGEARAQRTEKTGDKVKDSKPGEQPPKPNSGKSPGKEQQVAKAEDNSKKNNTDKESKKEPEQKCPT